MSNVSNPSPFIRTSRLFPQELKLLTVELDRAYIDLANSVNSKTNGTYTTNRPAITGETYSTSETNQQQTMRQVYTFSSTAAINHGILNVFAGQFINCYGSYTDGTSTYGLPFGTSVALAGLITFYVTSTQIVFVSGAGAPALSSGMIVLTWLNRP